LQILLKEFILAGMCLELSHINLPLLKLLLI